MTKKINLLFIALILSVSMAVAGCGSSDVAGIWVAGDFHNHTFLTDGSHKEQDVVSHAFDLYGLDWIANSEHGGSFNRDPNGNPWDATKILGDSAKDGNGNAMPGYMWRWQSIRDFSFPLLFDKATGLQTKYTNNILIQGVEWNVPKHEHASVGIVDQIDGKALSNFEYMFDQNDLDKSRSGEGLVKQNATHADGVAGAAYLQKNFKETSYYLLNHPSRKLLYSVADIRDFNNAAPDVFFGFEGFPGHQKETARGGYGNTFKDSTGAVDQNRTNLARTYGGADYMVAKVGGLWDSLLGEGRKFWAFVNSDFHSSADDADFYPGEYAKSYTFVTEKSARAIIAGMRSGNTFAVQGDLINSLDFSVSNALSNAGMGGEVTAAKGTDVTVTIRFRSPIKNNNGDKPVVDHIDLIVGDVIGKLASGDANYKKDTNASTKVLARFTSKDWTAEGDGYNKIVYKIANVQKNQYVRLRGTNLGLNIPNQTDQDGNPLNDDLVGPNTKAKAYADLWFYSNPVFIKAN